jgi:hypothetical protein
MAGASAMLDEAVGRILSADGFGIAAVHRAAASGAETPCSIIIDEDSEPVFQGGQVIIEEDRYTGHALPAELSVVAKGDEFTVTDSGAVYRVHEHPQIVDGTHRMVLRKES